MDFNLKNKKKTVTFNLDKNKTKILYVYTIASRESRRGSLWMQPYYDHLRFQRRIKEVENVLNHVLSDSHRLSIYNKRFKNL